MIRCTVIGLGLATAAVASPAQAEITPTEAVATGKVTKLEPTSPWALDYGENRCRLARIFGPAETPHLLFFDQASPRASFGVTLAGPEIDRYASSNRTYFGIKSETAMTRLDKPGRGDVAGYGVALVIAGTSLRSDMSDDDEADRQPGFRPAGVDIGATQDAYRVVLKSGNKVLSFETGPMKAPFEALNTCTQSMLIEWGLDPEEHRSYRPPRFTNVSSLAKKLQRSYPAAALRKRESGIFRMRVIVQADGTVSSCHLEQATIADSLDSPACKIVMEEARFEPAKNSDGKPIRSFYSTNITYAIN